MCGALVQGVGVTVTESQTEEEEEEDEEGAMRARVRNGEGTEGCGGGRGGVGGLQGRVGMNRISTVYALRRIEGERDVRERELEGRTGWELDEREG